MALDHNRIVIIDPICIGKSGLEEYTEGLFKGLIGLFTDTYSSKKEGTDGISRLKFLQISALGSFGVLLGFLTYGVIKGGYRYTIKNQKERKERRKQG